MGNRGILRFQTLAIYLHYYGGRATAEAIMRVCKALDFRTPGDDENYAVARACQIAGMLMLGNLSLGVYALDKAPQAYDNGSWIVGKDWKIVGSLDMDENEDVLECISEEEEKEAAATTALILRRCKAIGYVVVIEEAAEVPKEKRQRVAIDGETIDLYERHIKRDLL